jgi:hypothetical protein
VRSLLTAASACLICVAAATTAHSAATATATAAALRPYCCCCLPCSCCCCCYLNIQQVINDAFDLLVGSDSTPGRPLSSLVLLLRALWEYLHHHGLGRLLGKPLKLLLALRSVMLVRRAVVCCVCAFCVGGQPGVCAGIWTAGCLNSALEADVPVPPRPQPTSGPLILLLLLLLPSRLVCSPCGCARQCAASWSCGSEACCGSMRPHP